MSEQSSQPLFVVFYLHRTVEAVLGSGVPGFFIRWVLLATEGQTIGKKLFMIRVVTMKGRLPGFIQGVVLRNWLRNLLSMIPFFALIDVFFALGDSRRCIHDLLSGTRVVDAF